MSDPKWMSVLVFASSRPQPTKRRNVLKEPIRIKLTKGDELPELQRQAAAQWDRQYWERAHELFARGKSRGRSHGGTLKLLDRLVERKARCFRVKYRFQSSESPLREWDDGALFILWAQVQMVIECENDRHGETAKGARADLKRNGALNKTRERKALRLLFGLPREKRAGSESPALRAAERHYAEMGNTLFEHLPGGKPETFETLRWRYMKAKRCRLVCKAGPRLKEYGFRRFARDIYRGYEHSPEALAALHEAADHVQAIRIGRRNRRTPGRF